MLLHFFHLSFEVALASDEKGKERELKPTAVLLAALEDSRYNRVRVSLDQVEKEFI